MIANANNILVKLREEKRVGFEYQRRRHDDWDENYALYRNHVRINRLTQRQPVNVPLMKETVRTLLSKIDERPQIYFEDLGGNQDKEILLNAKWEEFIRTQNVELVDKVEKKQVLLFGRGTKKLNWCNGRVEIEFKDVMDVLIDPKTKPHDTESARFWVELNIFKPLRAIVQNEKYDKDARNELFALLNGSDDDAKEKNKVDTSGKVIPSNTPEMVQARNERLREVDISMPDDFAGTDTMIELNQHFTQIWDTKAKKYVRHVCVVAMDSVLLQCVPLKKAIGVEFWPFESWADDLEANDYYSDSVGDVLRVPNQIANIWYSQELENRTLANFGMNFYDKTIEGFEPEPIEPIPGGWYPLPGKPGEVFQRVDIRPFAGNLEAMQFVMGMADRAVAATSLEKGGLSPEKRTLGEVEIAVGKAEERISSITPFYRLAWQRFAEKWLAMNEANDRDTKPQAVYKKGFDNRFWKKEIKRSDWLSEQGYRVHQMNENQKKTTSVDEFNQLFAIKEQFPDNLPLIDAIREKALEIVNLTPEQKHKVKEFEKKRQKEGSAPIPTAPSKSKPPGAPSMLPLPQGEMVKQPAL